MVMHCVEDHNAKARLGLDFYTFFTGPLLHRRYCTPPSTAMPIELVPGGGITLVHISPMRKGVLGG